MTMVAWVAAVGLGLPVAVWLWRARRPPTAPAPPAPPKVDWNAGAYHTWGRAVEAAPGLLDAAALRLLGPTVTAAVLEQVMQAHPTPPAALDAAVVDEGPGKVPVFFKDGEPTTLAEYEGQAHVVSYLQAIVDGAPPDVCLPVEPQLFMGPAGLGKTLLTKCYANSLTQRNQALGLPEVDFRELFPADLPDVQALDREIRVIADRGEPTIVFIDEIHDLRSENHALKLYLLLEEGRYKFEDTPHPVALPNVVLMGATTDYGNMHPALKRRFNRHQLEPMTAAQIRSVLTRRAAATLPASPEAVQALVARTHFSGAPWEAIQLYRQALQFARARGSALVDVGDAERVFETQRIDELGLRWIDRRVLQVLLGMPRYKQARGGAREFVCYAASEPDVVAMAQIDRGEYRETVKPRLMARGLLEIRAGYGQALKPRAVEVYGWLTHAA